MATHHVLGHAEVDYTPN